MERKLAAILAADETATLAALKAHREAVFAPAVARYGGRIVKLMGDGVLVAFASVVDAVACAVAVRTASPGTVGSCHNAATGSLLDRKRWSAIRTPRAAAMGVAGPCR